MLFVAGRPYPQRQPTPMLAPYPPEQRRLQQVFVPVTQNERCPYCITPTYLRNDKSCQQHIKRFHSQHPYQRTEGDATVNAIRQRRRRAQLPKIKLPSIHGVSLGHVKLVHVCLGLEPLSCTRIYNEDDWILLRCNLNETIASDDHAAVCHASYAPILSRIVAVPYGCAVCLAQVSKCTPTSSGSSTTFRAFRFFRVPLAVNVSAQPWQLPNHIKKEARRRALHQLELLWDNVIDDNADVEALGRVAMNIGKLWQRYVNDNQARTLPVAISIPAATLTSACLVQALPVRLPMDR